MITKRRIVRWLSLPCLAAGGIAVGLGTINVPGRVGAQNQAAARKVANANFHSTPESLGKKVGKVRSHQNSNFQGVELKNGGFFVLTGETDAARIDAFGNVLYEFSPSELGKNHPTLNGKKVIEIAQDEGSDSNVLYLLLAPAQTIGSIQPTDQDDPYGYDEMVRDPSKQAVVVQITEKVYETTDSAWTPGFFVNQAVAINPQAMVANYPTQWKNNPDFFSKEDHPSWYANAKQRISDAVAENSSAVGGSMVMPWKQYVTSLGNMVAHGGIVYVFGGNGSMFHDPEALSVGMWKIDFNQARNNCVGIPYAYLLKNLRYSSDQFPADLSATIDLSNVNARWNESHAPIGQTEDFTYVPRIAVGGVQTDARGDAVSYFYLAGAITVGQVKASQHRLGGPNSAAPETLLKRRSLQLTGANAVTDPANTAANSIDPAMLFATAFSVAELAKVPLFSVQYQLRLFDKVLAFPGWFDVGATMASASSLPAYFYFDGKHYLNSDGSGTDIRGGQWWYINQGGISPTGNLKDKKTDIGRRAFPQSGETHAVGEVFAHDESGANLTNTSYAYNLSLMIENAVNYYYPTLSFGYSLKSVGSLTKVRMPKSADNAESEDSHLYGYAMQVGGSILYLNEPSVAAKDLAYHGPSTVMIGDEKTLGNARFNDVSPQGNNQILYPYSWIETKDQGASGYQITIDFSGTHDQKETDPARALGVGIFVVSIKDYNETVEQISSTFKISANPYATAAEVASQTDKSDPLMP